ncbi:helix-turn-helix domain-containing protein [Novosphingobium umbonatum]|uniref:Helix-turn-helix domain-containing protein n=2 Tax=Novosphingobium umbonatum TaxID=1908524 RepID=A0A3S2VU82_9SPHN|nr:helix-turn-helix domain-containing protein [Novosphingobium umbonatum]
MVVLSLYSLRSEWRGGGDGRERHFVQALALFDQSAQPMPMRKSPQDIRRYALYGEGNQPIAPEFLHIETISARSSQHEWTISPHAHPGIFQLLLLEAGHGEMVDDSGSRLLQPVSLVAVPSGAVHAFRFAEEAQGWVLSVADALLHDARLAGFATIAELFAPAAGGAMLCRLDGMAAASRRLGWLLADLAQAMAGGEAGALPAPMVAELAMVLTLAGESLSGENQPKARAGRDALVARFRRLVDAHFREGWSVTTYAAALATTPPTLTRACRQVLGKAPGDVVQDRLLLEAMRLLTYTTSSVGQIAQSLGFADPAYFARFFKARSGSTASDFRQQRAWLA